MVFARFSGLPPTEEGLVSSSLDPNELYSLARSFEQGGELLAAGELYGSLAGSHGEAGERLRAISGEGGFSSARAEFLADQFVDQVTDPAALGAMLGAGATYRSLRGVVGALPAFAVEATAFPLYIERETLRWVERSI